MMQEKERQASMMHPMRNMMAELTKDNDRSESSSAEGSAGVGGSSRGAGPTAVRETCAAPEGVAPDTAAARETTLR